MAINNFLPLCNVQASAVILATPVLSTTGVLCMAVDSSTGDVYIGGDFQQVNGANRKCLACINRSGVLKAWNPGVGAGTYVNDMRFVAGVGLYVIGTFSGIGGGTGTTSRAGQALIDTSGNVQAWDPNPTNVGGLPQGGGAIEVDGSGNIYLSNGDKVYQVSAAAVVSAWPGQLNSLTTPPFQKMCIIGTKLYCVGGYSVINTSAVTTATTSGLCRIDTTTGYCDNWVPAFLAGGFATAVLITGVCADSGGTLYVAGHFTTALGTTQSRFASIATAGPTLNSWLPVPNASAGDGYRVAANGLDIYWSTASAGLSNSVGCMSSTGTDLAWDPYTGGSHGGANFIAQDVNVFGFDTSNPIVPAVWIGGYFSTALNANTLGPIVRLQVAKYADRTFSPTHLAY